MGNYCPFLVCTPVEVDQGQIAIDCQALFSATGLIGASEPEDIEDADDGDILDVVVNPNGKAGGPPDAAVTFEMIEDGIWSDLDEPSISCDPLALWCCAVGTYKLLYNSWDFEKAELWRFGGPNRPSSGGTILPSAVE